MRNCISAAGVATAIQSSSWRSAAISGTEACTAATTSATISAKCPSSATTLVALPFAGGLERVDDFLRHIGLVVLGQHLARHELAVRAHAALGHHALAFLEQVRHQAGEGHVHHVL